VKLSLPVKLGIFVVLVFSAVIAACLLWTPVKLRYYFSKFQSPDMKTKLEGIDGLISIGSKGKKALAKGFEGKEKAADLISKSWHNVNFKFDDVKDYARIHQPVHIAAKNGWLDVLKVLKAKGADLNARINAKNAKGHCGYTPLHLAALGGYNNIIRFLLANGVDICQIDDYKSTALHKACGEGNLETVRLLINKGADIEARNSIRSATPLLDAMREPHIDVVKYLIEKGADVKAFDKHGFGVIHKAARKGNIEIAKLMLKIGADIEQRATIGTPIYWAASSGQKEFIEFLINAGASLDNIDNEGSTLMHAACIMPDLKTIEYLFEKGFEINARDKNNFTPVFWAACNSDLKVVEFIVNKGAELNILSKENKTPLDYAIEESTKEIINLLRSHGASTGEELREEAERKK
jgi:ankyrin repeat protein